MSRPEHQQAKQQGGADFYTDKEAARYDTSQHMNQTQAQMTERAVELLGLSTSKPGAVLDIGCGSGASSRGVSKHGGHFVVGFDLSTGMAQQAAGHTHQRSRPGVDYFVQDMGHKFPFKARAFDAAVSISAVQWFFAPNEEEEVTAGNLEKFFRSLSYVLVPGAPAVLQLYPEMPEHMTAMRDAALKHGRFSGSLVVDYPRNLKAKKFYLVLTNSKGGGSREERYGGEKRGRGSRDDDGDAGVKRRAKGGIGGKGEKGMNGGKGGKGAKGGKGTKGGKGGKGGKGTKGGKGGDSEGPRRWKKNDVKKGTKKSGITKEQLLDRLRTKGKGIGR